MTRLFLLFALITMLLLGYGLYQGLLAAPTEQTMGDIQRIFYYHVPSAWTAFLLFFVNFVASIVYLASRRSAPERALRSDAIAVSSAEVGVVFTSIVLVTGPLWAKPVWGIWWTWDARLTTTLVLWLIYVSYLLLRRFTVTPVAPAVLGIFGFLDVPIVYMSIRWWRTQHPQPVIGGGEGSGIHPDMFYALMVNWAAFLAYGFLVMWARYSLERSRQKVEEAAAMASLRETPGAAR